MFTPISVHMLNCKPVPKVSTVQKSCFGKISPSGKRNENMSNIENMDTGLHGLFDA